MQLKTRSNKQETKVVESTQWLILLNHNINGENKVRLEQNAKHIYFSKTSL